jgi:hypothetical protein
MRRTAVLACLVVLGLSQPAGATSESDDNNKSEANKGLSVEDLGHALKSAEQNIEREIPKIGPAIVNTIDKLTDKAKEQDKQSPQDEKKQNE